MPESEHRATVQTECKVRFSDTDAMGHVNNACFFTYMEQARVAYLRRLAPDVDYKAGLKSFPFILADIQCSFKTPLYVDEIVIVSISVDSIGTKSFVFDYRLTEQNTGRTVATGRSVQVLFDYVKEVSFAMPEDMRQTIEALEGRSLA